MNPDRPPAQSRARPSRSPEPQSMYYVFIARDIPGTLAQRLAARPAHLERLVALQQQGRLLRPGPIPATDTPAPGPAGFVGSLIVAEFDDQSAAQAWADADPYC